MISSKQLAISITNDLDQNAYTSWHDSPKILDAINDACNFVLAYAKRPWSLESWEIILTVKWRSFKFAHELFYPYRAYLDERLVDITLIPIIDFLHKDTGKVYVDLDTVKTTDDGLKLNILYHRWHVPLLSLWTDDIDIPRSMFQAITHVALRFVYPGGLDIGAGMANQNFNMAKALLDTYAKAYWKSVQPKDMQPSAIYN